MYRCKHCEHVTNRLLVHSDEITIMSMDVDLDKAELTEEGLLKAILMTPAGQVNGCGSNTTTEVRLICPHCDETDDFPSYEDLVRHIDGEVKLISEEIKDGETTCYYIIWNRDEKGYWSSKSFGTEEPFFAKHFDSYSDAVQYMRHIQKEWVRYSFHALEIHVVSVQPMSVHHEAV